MSDPVPLSVVVPVYNDPEGIRETLGSLTDQREAPPYEVLVVDNNSTDGTADAIAEFESSRPDLVRGLSETEVQSSYAARNTGIEHAAGDVIAFVDADMTVGERWARKLVDAFEESAVDYLGYRVEMHVPAGRETVWAWYDAAMGLPVEHYVRTKRFAPTCALAVRRGVIDSVGPFDETLVSGGDKEFGNRVHEAGFAMGYTDSIAVGHPVRASLSAHVGKAARIGRGQARLWRDHGLAATPYSPTRVLPPSPTRVRNRMDGSGSFAPIYAIEYGLKLVQTASAIGSFARGLEADE